MVSKTWFISRAGQQHGPITDDEFRKFVELGHLKADDLVWSEGATDWKPGASFLDHGKTHAATAPAPAVAHAVQGAPVNEDELTPMRRSWVNGGTIFLGLIVLVIVGVAIAEPGSVPYRVAGAINGAVFGAIAGAIAALLQYLIKKKLTAAPVGVAVALGFNVGQAAESSINLVGGLFYEQRARPVVTKEIISRMLDSVPVYQALKRADPQSYSDFRSEVAKRVANGASASEIEKYAETYTASFRRTNAAAALAAPPSTLTTLMKTLGDIVDYLHTRDETLCAEYALQALGSQRIRSLAREPDFSALIQRHAAAVFDAIGDGLRHKRAYEPLTETDIQLAIQGVQMRGWTDQMRAALAEPSQLGMLPPGLVCRIQREWLATLASLPEPTRTRWYREMLAPMLRS
jgi:hypothetical protein